MSHLVADVGRKGNMSSDGDVNCVSSCFSRPERSERTQLREDERESEVGVCCCPEREREREGVGVIDSRHTNAPPTSPLMIRGQCGQWCEKVTLTSVFIDIIRFFSVSVCTFNSYKY